MNSLLRLATVVGLAGTLAACGGGSSGDDVDAPPGNDGAQLDGGDPGPVLRRASKSSTIALSDDDARVAMVNPEDDSVSIFTTSDDVRTAKVTTGDEPSSVVIAPDGTTAYVTNRADATVVKVTAIDTGSPSVGTPTDVGAEPTGVALSPTGRRLYVANYGEATISVIDTATMAVTQTIPTTVAVRAIAVTNDGDTSDDDEVIVAPAFYGEKGAGAEGTDTSRRGKVKIYSAADGSPQTPVVFEPIDSGFAPDGAAAGTPTVFTSPNQLWAVAVQGNKFFVPTISSSPAAPIKFNTNVHPVALVGDVTGTASTTETKNLARLVFDAIPSGTRFALADTVDVSFAGLGDSKIAYYVSRGADVVQRVTYDTPGVAVGSAINKQIDVLTPPAGGGEGCKTPTGIVAGHESARGYVNCWQNRKLGVIDFSTQALAVVVESAPAPVGPEVDVALGRRFFFTGRGRWSKDAWSSCGSCHPDGASDNMTWIFGAGPRQSTTLEGSYSHGPGTQIQRVFNWTGIFDEMHDFERNTRGTSGGVGAVTTAPAAGVCGDPATEQQATISANGMGQPVKEVQDQVTTCEKDWDKIELWAKQLRPQAGRKALDAASVARGRALFGEPGAGNNNGGCVRCHGGAGFTLSRRFFVPSTAGNTALTTQAFTRPALWPAAWNAHTTQIQAEQPGAIGPQHVACVLRAIGTFGVPGDTTASTALEVKADGTAAQGVGGYNIPSLYGLQTGAPYLHHGGAATLEELFTDGKWSGHTTAGNPNFLQIGDVAADRADLINYLLSIDATVEEPTVPAGWDGCP